MKKFQRTWPKVCGSCRANLDEEAWHALVHVGTQTLPAEYGDMGIPDLELRNCVCGSTIAQPLEKTRVTPG